MANEENSNMVNREDSNMISEEASQTTTTATTIIAIALPVKKLVTEMVLEDEMEPCVLSPEELKARYTSHFEYEKGTNIAKFLIRVFFEFEEKFETFLADEREKPMHLSWLSKTKIQMDERKNKTIKDMECLFGIRENDRQTKWATERRTFFHLLLATQSKRDMIMLNNYIKGGQKVHYMYSLKVYEWRLNDARLISNFN
jgi:hypothetical protein